MRATGTPEDFVRASHRSVTGTRIELVARPNGSINRASPTAGQVELIISTFWRTYLKFDPDVQYNAVLAPCHFFIAGAVRKLPFYPLLIGEAQALKARAYLLCDVSE